MATFDIFIKGINPERAGETEAIRANSAKALQISVAHLDELLAQRNGACIRRDATEDEAINYQRTLSKLGLICLYSPAKKLTNLELLPIEEELVTTSVSCPNCQLEIPVSEDVEPEKCAECGVDIAKFLEQQRQNEEREAIKAKLLASQGILKAQETKKQQENAEKQRKSDLEKEVLQELGADTEAKKPLNVKFLAITGGLLVLTVGGYFFAQPSSTLLAPDVTPSLATGTEIKPAGSEIEKTSQAQIAEPLDAQQAMQKTHDQAAQVLSGFGLNPDAFANNAGAGGNVTTATNLLPEATALKTPVNANTAAAAPISTASPTQAISAELLATITHDITWDKFLAQNSKTLLERQLPENAVQLSKFIVAPEVYVDALGELLRAAQQAKQTKLVDDYLTALDARLTPLSVEQQAIYFTQASGYLAMENGTNRLLTKAENLLASLPKPELQLTVVLKLAVLYSKTGNIANANNYFNKINTLLTPITDLDSQAQLRAAVALAYQEINNAPVAMQWLDSIQPLLKQLKPESVSTLMVSYAKCNQWQSALNVLAQGDTSTHDAWLYRAIETSLQSGFVTNAVELQKSLQTSVYKALANVLIANYSPSANEFLATAEQALNSLSQVEKIIVASQLVDYYGKLKNTAKAESFVTLSQDALASLPVSDEKDALLDTVIKRYAHGFQTKAAANLLVAVQSLPLKMRLNVEINQLANMGGLLK